MGWERQTSDEEVEEIHPPPIAGARDHLVARKSKGSLVGEDAHLLQLLMILFVKCRSLPPGDLAFSAGVVPAATRLTCFDLIIEGVGEQCGTGLSVDELRASNGNGASKST